MTVSERLGVALDGALSVVAPVWAMRRAAARAQLSVMRRSRKLRTLSSSAPGRTSGRRAHLLQGPKDKTAADIETSRAQARDLFRHNAYARGVVNTITANLVSTGIKPQARVVRVKKRDLDEELNDRLEDVWASWVDGADPTGRVSFYEQQAQILRELYVAGECLLVFGTPSDGREIPLSTEVVPSERLSMKDEPEIPASRGGGKILQGVEFDANGGIRGYWVYPNHPFDTNYGLRAYEPSFLPADRVIHFYDELEPGQIRGLTRFLTVGNAFEAFLQWLDFILVKERVASAFAVAILRNSGDLTTPLSTGNAADQTDDADNEVDYLEGGIIAHLKPGESIEGISSHVQASAVDQLAQVFLRVVARGLDVSYELVSRDLSRVTYLSARQGENQDRRHWEPQQEFQNRRVNRPVWRKVQQAALQAGKLGTLTQLDRRLLAVEFIRPGWPWIDPSKDVSSTIDAIKNGLRSPIEEIIQRGGTPRKVLRDLAEFKQIAEEEGLDLELFSEKPEDAVSKAIEAFNQKKGKGNGKEKDDDEEKAAA